MHANPAINLDGYSLGTELIQICCLEENHLDTTIPHLTLINFVSQCKGYSNNISIHSKSDLNSGMDTSVRHEILIGFNAIYKNMARYGIWYE